MERTNSAGPPAATAPPALVLASTSPYRRDLLARLGLPFLCEAPGVDEDAYKSAQRTPQWLAEDLALAKARAVAERFPAAVVLGSDQVCACEGRILDKPGTEERAREQLAFLQGKTHELITAVAVVHPAGVIPLCEIACLTLRRLSAEEIARYVAAERPLDCAGSYKLEALGVSLFSEIDAADHTAIIGLPLLALCRVLRDLGFALP